ncbi:MAG: carboxynorspermidine decarboxylase [Clostridia bacterium]|nr:carboxynorspermidine decarboxylase [Clostridia bacterium]
MKTPYYLISEKKLKDNLKILNKVKAESGCKILLAQKCYSIYQTYPLLSSVLDGTCSSGPFEAELSHKYFGKENHVHKIAFSDDDISKLVDITDFIVFNSENQLSKYAKYFNDKKIGLRINPEFSTQEKAIYDPSKRFSRMGITEENLKKIPPSMLDSVSGFHFHTLCEQNSDDLSATLDVFEEKFSKYLWNLEWLNFGGGHHITRADYDLDLLIDRIKYFSDKYNIQIYLEPGEAVALDAGELVTTVLDIVQNEKNIAVLDTSAACHMPDVLEMPYRPPLKDSAEVGEREFNYILAGPTCLAGDIIGEYSFDRELKIGDELYFQDMAIYTMVKNNTFNGMPLPSIVLQKENGEQEVLRKFGYSDFESRL